MCALKHQCTRHAQTILMIEIFMLPWPDADWNVNSLSTKAALQVVLLPIAIGGWLNRQFPRQVARASPFAPLLAMTMTVLICGSILAVNASAVRTAGPRLLAAVAALHSGELVPTRAVQERAGVHGTRV